MVTLLCWLQSSIFKKPVKWCMLVFLPCVYMYRINVHQHEFSVTTHTVISGIFEYCKPIFCLWLSDSCWSWSASRQHAQDQTMQLRTLITPLLTKPTSPGDLCTPVPRGGRLALLCYHGNTCLARCHGNSLCTLFFVFGGYVSVWFGLVMHDDMLPWKRFL